VKPAEESKITEQRSIFPVLPGLLALPGGKAGAKMKKLMRNTRQ